MKNKIILSSAMLIVSIAVSAQSWSTGTSLLYASPTSTKVGIGIISPTERLHINGGALKIGNSSNPTDRSQNLLKFGDGSFVQIGEWENDDMLSFKANSYNFTNGNLGIGVTNPQYKLDVNGKMFLHTVDGADGWYRSYLQWESHKLIMGVPAGTYAYTMVDIIPGGVNQDSLFSQLRLFTATAQNVQTPKISLNTMQHCWFMNTGNFGIGTSTPQYKLDVNGTIRANEIIVNTTGADFVFEKDYNLRSLKEVESFIIQNKHLPEIPSAAEMQEEGVGLERLTINLLRKVEEMTLYIIKQEKRIQELENQINGKN